MKIYPHKTRGYQVWYTLFFPDGGKDKKCRFRPTKALAEEISRLCETIESGSRRGDLSQREILRARHEGLISEDEARRLNGGKSIATYCLDTVLQRYELSSKVANTPYSHSCNMNRVGHLKKWLQDHPIPRLSESDIKEFIQGRKDGTLRFPHPKTGFSRAVSSKSVNIEVNILRQIIDEAISLGMTEDNPARRVDVPVKAKKVPRALAGWEVKKLLEQAWKDRKYCYGYLWEITVLALYAGLRRREICYARWEVDIDLENRKFHVQAKKLPDGSWFTPKSGEARTVNIPDRLFPILEDLHKRKTGPFVFGGENPLRLDTMTHSFKALIIRAGLDPSLSLHNTRHTYLSHMLRKTGGDIKYVQQLGGHSDPETTKKYLHAVFTPDAPEMDLDYGEENFSQIVDEKK